MVTRRDQAMGQLDHEVVAALRALFVAHTPDAAAIERAWAALQVRLVDGPPLLDTSLVGDTSRRRVGRNTVVVVLAALVIATLGLAGLSRGWLVVAEHDDGALVAYAREPVAPEELPPPSARVGPVPASTSACAPAIEREPAAAKVVRAPRSPRRPKVSKPRRASADLEAELRLLSRATAAMRSGRHADALDVLEQHARDFPRGQLAPERDYKRARTLCELGHTEASRTVADAFVRAYPGSPMRTKVLEICREGAQ